MAKRLSDAGAFGVVLELIPAELSGRITAAIDALTIGIGAGINCDGEIQVWHDVLGLSAHKFKHAKSFLGGRDLITKALADYSSSVRDHSFPTEENSF